MKGMQLTFKKRVATGKDALNNDTYEEQEIVVEDCLVAPISEPTTIREQQALTQNKIQVRVHLPKTCTDDVSNSSFDYDTKTFRLDSDSVAFMPGNTPTRWNRYFRGEVISG